MAQQLYTSTPVPSSILHNSTNVRAHYTRVAAKQASDAIRKQFELLYKQVRARKTWQNPPMPES